jgi:hypothetical protein
VPTSDDHAKFSDRAGSSRIAVAYAADSASALDVSLPQNPASDSASFSDVAAVIMDLGRVRRGDWIPLSFTLPSLPDSIPVAVILNSDSAQMAALMVPAINPTGTIFSLLFQITSAFSVSNYQVFYSSVVAGQSVMQRAQFEVVAGGDSGGAVIALYSVDRQEVRSIVAQLDSGVLVLGRSPTVQE